MRYIPKDLKIPVKKSYTKKSSHQISPDSFIKEYRDPAGRVSVHKDEEFKLPVPGKITSLRAIPSPSKKIEKKQEIKGKQSDKLSDYL